jgi:plastocyanin
MENTDQPKQSSYGKRPMWQWLLIYVVIGGILYYGVYYFMYAKKTGDYKAPSNMYQTQPTQQPAGQTMKESGSSVQEITVEGNEFAFTPSTLTVKKGEEVKVMFKNTGKYPHNFVVADINVTSKTIQPGQSDTVIFTPEKAGSYEYNCSIGNHTEKGMTGTLTVQ